MKNSQLFSILQENPIICAVKNQEDLSCAIETDCPVVFILFGNVNNISQITSRISDAKKLAFVHIDLVEGLFPCGASVEFIKENTSAAGIITTKAQLIKKAKELNLLAIQRFFVLDSLALQTTIKQMESSCADMFEVLPGVMPKVLKKIAAASRRALIAGGLISDKEDVINAISAGCTAVSTSCSSVWQL